jgi:hypothetical protein
MRLRVKIESNEWYYINDQKILSVFFWDPGPPILCFFALHYSNSFQGKKRRVSFLDLFVVNQS